MTRLMAAILSTGLLFALPASGAKNHHVRYVGDYEGTKTCLECHREEAEQFISSQHYQWEGGTPDLVNADGKRYGKMSMINDFCTNPSGHQWIGEVKNADGKVLAKGCSNCHAGLGKLPGTEVTDEELENVDCLICHASGYRRNLNATPNFAVYLHGHLERIALEISWVRSWPRHVGQRLAGTEPFP